MKIKYDPQADILYLELKDTTVTTKRISPDIAVDYDAQGAIAGLELIGAKNNILAEDKLSFELDNVFSRRQQKEIA